MVYVKFIKTKEKSDFMLVCFSILLLLTCILLLFVLQKLKTATIIGLIGENIVSRELENIVGYKKIINNIMINDNGKSRQIDHIAITEYGVFVIETKNCAGSIYGKETSSEWKKYINHKCYIMKNPIHQNYGHLQIVKKTLDEITQEVYQIIVFTSRSVLHIESKVPVLQEKQLCRYINTKNKIFSQEQINLINKVILENRITNREQIKYHNQNVKQYVENIEYRINNQICPRCGGKLLKKYKYSYFWGCSNYPKCKYIKKIYNQNIKEEITS